MCEQLAMPKRLRGSQVRALIDARLSGDPRRFAAAYDTYKSGRKVKSEQALLDRAENGDETAMLTLWGWFINDAVEDQKTIITDDEAKRRLELARGAIGGERSEICQQLRDYFQEQINDYADTLLYPGQQTEKAAAARAAASGLEPDTLASLAPEASLTAGQTQVSPASSAVSVTTRDHALDIARENDAVQTQWNKLANSILGSAERMWRDLFLDPKNPPHERTLLSIAHVSQQLMLLWLEVALYQDRAYGNYAGRVLESEQSEQDADDRRRGREQSTRTGIRKHVVAYHEAIKKWEDELTKCMRKPKSGSYFRSHQLESQQFRRLIPQFSTAKSNELGWTAQATDARAELRYQLRDELRREYRAGGHPFAAFGMYILKITTGYGTRPAFFFRTVGIVFLVDVALFFLNDFFNPGFSPTPWSAPHFCATSAPHIQQWTNYWDEFVRYAYIAITHLTSLGLNSSLTSYCGGTFSEIVVVFSTVAGYFMLGLLSAMLYTLLTQSD